MMMFSAGGAEWSSLAAERVGEEREAGVELRLAIPADQGGALPQVGPPTTSNTPQTSFIQQAIQIDMVEEKWTLGSFKNTVLC